MSVSFDGEWKIDLSGSKTWDDRRRAYVRDNVGSENIRINTVRDVQNVYMEIGVDPVVYLEYKNIFDDKKWSPYVVKSICGASSDVDSVRKFSDRLKLPHSFKIGDPIFFVRTLYVDHRTHYRLNKNSISGNPEYVMSRVLSENGSYFMSSVMRMDGVVTVIRKFVRT